MSEIDIRKLLQGELSTILKEEINNIAPEVDLSTVDPTADLREAVDIDSMDFLNLITALHKRTGIDVPEIDYPKLLTLSGMLAYFQAELKSRKP
jgi:acyl carrier protein